jgi:hypothetical protein
MTRLAQEARHVIAWLRVPLRCIRILFFGVALTGLVVNVQRYAVHERLDEAVGTLKGFELRREKRSEGGLGAMPDQWVDYVVVDFRAEYSAQNRTHVASRYAFSQKLNAFRVADEETRQMLVTVSHWSPGMKLPIWFDPKEPGFSVVDKSFSTTQQLAVFSIVGLLGIGLLVLSWVKQATWEKREPSHE